MANDTHDHAWTHDHVYLGAGHERAEARTRFVTWMTVVFMAVEIAAGFGFHSMALLADGVHMVTHVGALGLAAWAYFMARRHAKNRRFSFGSGKFGDLAGFASALLLGVVSLAVAGESISRLYAPVEIHYQDAIIVAAFGLCVNLISAFVLQDHHDRAHPHNDEHIATHRPGHAHHDYNLRAAYVHVLADAATSVLTLIALGAGIVFGWAFLDPTVGLLGAFVIASWAMQLLRQTALVLLDVEDDPHLAADIRRTLEADLNTQIADLHLWRLGPGHRGLIVSLVSPTQLTSEDIREELRRRHPGLSHVTIEISVCEDCTR
jgi:cation diffusion facilitator family transporter